MRDYTWISTERKLAAKVGLAYDHPVFTEFPTQETGFAFTEFCQHLYAPTFQYNTLRQYVLRTSNNSVYRSVVTLPETGASLTRSFSLFAALPAEAPNGPGYIDLASGHTIGTSTDRVYLALNGKVYYYNVNTWTEMYDFAGGPDMLPIPILAVTGIDSTRVAVAAVYIDDVNDHCELSVLEGGAVDTWRGHLPKSSTKPGLAVVEGPGGVIHFYVDNWNQKRPMHVKRLHPGVWSAAAPILPIDAVDEDSTFKVSHASKLYGSNERIILTGQLKRQYGDTFGIYMQGPDKFTFGRDLILTQNPTSSHQIFKTHNDTVWAVGPGNTAYCAKCTGIFHDNPYDPSVGETLTDAEIHGFTADFAVNQAGRLSLEVPPSFVASHPTLALAGARVDLSISENGGAQFYSKLCSFGVDRIVEQITSDGNSYLVECTSASIKKLMDWESDTYFDYLAQGEVHGDPGDLTKLVRVSGSHFVKDAAGGLRLESLNDDGMLYTTPPSSHGGFIKCKFTNVQIAGTLMGVGLNYGEETLAEAAARMSAGEIDPPDRGRFGLFAIYHPNPLGEDIPAGQVWLCDYNTIRKGYGADATITNAWRVITKANVDRPAANGTLMLAMQYQDGYARVYYANSDSALLTQVMSAQTILDGEIHPVEHENYGRGAIYLRNNTGFHMSFPMSSTSDAIPLYSFTEKYRVTGVPLEDRVDKFPASWGTVKVDSEQILYGGTAGWQNGTVPGFTNRYTLDLEWVPGEVICSAGDGTTTPAGTDADFARLGGSGIPHVHGNNYILQSFDLGVGVALTALRIWLKKVNFPEDTVTVTINVGSVATSATTVRLINNVVASTMVGTGADVTETGGWVTFNLNTDLIGQDQGTNKYWIMIRRNKSPNNPNSFAYFQYKRMADTAYANHSAYLFCEEDDTVVAAAGDMAFVAYAKVGGAGMPFCVPVKYLADAGLSDADDYFANCALVATEGEGRNNSYRIGFSKRYTSPLNEQLYLFYINEAPGQMFDFGTKFRAVPALFQLSHGQSSTVPSAHGNASYVSLPTSVFSLAKDFEYYTAEEDKTLAEVAEDIARKAGVMGINLNNTPVTSAFAAVTQNLIAVLELPSLALNETVTLSFVGDGVDLTMTLTQGTTTSGQITITHTGTTVLDITADEAFWGAARLSLYDGRLSFWNGGRLVCSTIVPAITWTQFTVDCSNAAKHPTRSIPQAGTRVDNFVMDMGKTGSQLLQSLIGEKRVYYQDDQDGKFTIFTTRETGRTLENFMGYTKEQTDIGLATRILLEGGEVVEVSSVGNIRQYGNFFKTYNFSDINNLVDAKYYADMIMEDTDLNRERIDLSGSADPGIEPTDRLTITMKDASTRDIVVDQVGFTMQADDQDAVFDMRLVGRFVPEVA